METTTTKFARETELNSENCMTSIYSAVPKKHWLWRNFVNGNPEYWCFDNPYPCHPNGDPITLGEPCGYVVFKSSINGRPDRTD